MHRYSTAIVAIIFSLLLAGCGSSASVAPDESANSQAAGDSRIFPSEEELLALIKARVDQKQATGIVLAVREADGTHSIVSYGEPGPGALPLGPRSVFEIGSITKVFTGILLADMAARGQLGLEDSAQSRAHAGVTIPSSGKLPIRLVDLATHMSGLPRMPDNFMPANPENPYADYSVDQMHQFLSTHTLGREVGSKHEYSNLGTGLLGHILAAVNGTNWETLAKTRILDPLGMTMTGVMLTPEMQKHLARGHNQEGKVVSNWDIPTFAGAGTLRSNAEDMLRFLDANLQDGTTPMQVAMRTSHKPRVDTGPKMKIGLNWVTKTTDQHQLIWHNGGTGGYRSFLGFDTKRKVGVVVLENSTHGPDDLGLHLLDSSLPLKATPREHKEVEVKTEILAEYVGVYELSPTFHLNVTLEGGKLVTQATNQSKVPIFAESETDFFAKVVDAQGTFVRGKSGKIEKLILHQSGMHQPALRLEGEKAKAAIESIVSKEHQEIEVKAEILKEYVGRYELTPTFHMTVTLKGDKLVTQATNQPEVPIFATTETHFFAKVVNAQLTFVRDETGKISKLILHQGGRDTPAKKVE